MTFRSIKSTSQIITVENSMSYFGDSGGPLLNSKGHLVGLTCSIHFEDKKETTSCCASLTRFLAWLRRRFFPAGDFRFYYTCVASEAQRPCIEDCIRELAPKKRKRVR